VLLGIEQRFVQLIAQNLVEMRLRQVNPMLEVVANLPSINGCSSWVGACGIIDASLVISGAPAFESLTVLVGQLAMVSRRS